MALIDRIQVNNIHDFENKYNSLSDTEKMYFDYMKSKHGVLFITAKPGVGKSAILRSIADKLDINFIDLRLSMLEESDVGLFPKVSVVRVNGVEISALEHVVPLWAIKSNERPCIIVFEELNRSQLAVRNASLQILLEREIGYNFKFNDNVYMASTGNLGEDDGTIVDEFDSALNNRLIHVKHILKYKEWYDNFAKDNVIADIIEYLELYPNKLYKYNEDSTAYPTPRTWTMLSDFIINNLNKTTPSPKEIYDLILDRGASFIGNEILGLIQFLKDKSSVSYKDILNNFDEINFEDFSLPRFTNILNDLAKLDYNELNNGQIDNVITYLKLTNGEDRVSFFISVIDNIKKTNTDKIYRLFEPFKKEVDELISATIDYNKDELL